MMNKQAEEKNTLRENWNLIKRAIGIWEKIMPHFWVWQMICTLFETFTPYFGLYMSAALINELADGGDYKKCSFLRGLQWLEDL